MVERENGWADAPFENDFIQHFGQIQRRREGERWVYAVRADTRHRNGAGMMHGGAMTAFIDEVVGTVVAQQAGRPHVTVQLSSTFLQAVQIGEFLEIDCEIVRTTRSMAFVEARLTVGTEIVATASLILKASAGEATRG